MQNQMSRREALAGIGLAGATGMLPIGAAAIAQARAVDRLAWDRAFATYQQAKAVYDHEQARHEPIYEAYQAEADAVPHAILRPDPYSGHFAPVSTANWHLVRDARRLVKDVAAGKCWLETDKYPSLKDHWELCQDLAAAADTRDAAIHRIDQRHGYTRSWKQVERAMGVMEKASRALHDIPAPDGPALVWKMEDLWLGDEEAAYGGGLVSQLLADARRLLVNGRA
jgi:hypothetical protein